MSDARPLSGSNHPKPWRRANTGEPETAPVEVETDADAGLPPAVPGFCTGRLLGRGGTASVWLVTDSAGRTFALKVAHTPPVPQPLDAPTPPTPAVPLPATPPPPGRRALRRAEPDVAEAAVAEAARTAGSARRGEDGRNALPPRSEKQSEDLHREVALLERLHHEHLLRVYCVLDTDQGPSLLMELAAGGSLLDLVRSRGPLPIAEVVTSLVPVAQALGHLHDAGALHGDVTPGNILFTNEGKPLLGDFGTRRLLGADPVLTPGTPGFIDPARSSTYDAGIDVFALAAVAWFALTGRVPGPAEQRPPLALIVPEVPDALMQLIEDGLSSSRERRPTAASFARSLLSASTPVPVNLVPAVHSSVLPDLLTRRADAAPTKRRSRWGRTARRSAGKQHSSVPPNVSRADWRRRGLRRVPRASESVGRSTIPPVPREGGPRVVVGGSRGSRSENGRGPGVMQGAAQRPRTDRLGPPTAGGLHGRRRALAVVSAGIALVLLVVGIVLTAGGLQGPAQLVSERAVQDDDAAARTVTTGVGEAADGSPEDAAPADADADTSPGSTGTGGRNSQGDAAARELRVASADPVEALGGLVELRASAFGTADAGILRSVDVDGSPAMAADQEAVAALDRAGSIFQDLSITLRDPQRVTGSDLSDTPALATVPGITQPPANVDIAVVRATAQISSYTTEVAPDAGGGVETAPDGVGGAGAGSTPLMAAGRQELLFVLWNTVDGWRIHSVVEPPS